VGRRGGGVKEGAGDEGGGVGRAGRRGVETMVQEIEAAVAPYQVLLVTDIQLRSYRDLRQCQNQPSACPDFPPGVIEGALIRAGKWRKTGKERSFGLYDSQVTILERAEKHSRPVSAISD